MIELIHKFDCWSVFNYRALNDDDNVVVGAAAADHSTSRDYCILAVICVIFSCYYDCCSRPAWVTQIANQGFKFGSDVHCFLLFNYKIWKKSRSRIYSTLLDYKFKTAAHRRLGYVRLQIKGSNWKRQYAPVIFFKCCRGYSIYKPLP